MRAELRRAHQHRLVQVRRARELLVTQSALSASWMSRALWSSSISSHVSIAHSTAVVELQDRTRVEQRRATGASRPRVSPIGPSSELPEHRDGVLGAAERLARRRSGTRAGGAPSTSRRRRSSSSNRTNHRAGTCHGLCMIVETCHGSRRRSRRSSRPRATGARVRDEHRRVVEHRRLAERQHAGEDPERRPPRAHVVPALDHLDVGAVLVRRGSGCPPRTRSPPGDTSAGRATVEPSTMCRSQWACSCGGNASSGW